MKSSGYFFTINVYAFSERIEPMKLFKKNSGALCALFSLFLFNITAFAEEFTEEDRLAFGIMPIWLLLMILAAVTALAIIIIIEIVKRKHK